MINPVEHDLDDVFMYQKIKISNFFQINVWLNYKTLELYLKFNKTFFSKSHSIFTFILYWNVTTLLLTSTHVDLNNQQIYKCVKYHFIRVSR